MKKYVLYTPNNKADNIKYDIEFISKYAIDGKIIKKYTGQDKIHLAIRHALRNGALLIVALLKHLGSNPKEVIDLTKKTGFQHFVCCEAPFLNEQSIEVLFYSKERMNDYSAVCSSIGKKGQGTPQNFNNDGRKKGGEVMKQRAKEDPANKEALPEIIRLREMGIVWQGVAERLNDKGMRTTTGKFWTAASVYRVWERR